MKTGNVKCGCCGKTIPYRESYLSRILEDEYGAGKRLCYSCNEREIDNLRNIENTQPATKSGWFW